MAVERKDAHQRREEREKQGKEKRAVSTLARDLSRRGFYPCPSRKLEGNDIRLRGGRGEDDWRLGGKAGK